MTNDDKDTMPDEIWVNNGLPMYFYLKEHNGTTKYTRTNQDTVVIQREVLEGMRTVIENQTTEQQQSGWRDIASAPRDGTYIVATDGEKLAVISMDEKQMIEDGYIPEWIVSIIDINNGFEDVTHWMPLPPPPTNEEG